MTASSMYFKWFCTSSIFSPLAKAEEVVCEKQRHRRRGLITRAGANGAPWIEASSDGEQQAGRHRGIRSKVLVDQRLVLQLHPLRRGERPPHPRQHPQHVGSPWAQAQPFITRTSVTSSDTRTNNAMVRMHEENTVRLKKMVSLAIGFLVPTHARF